MSDQEPIDSIKQRIAPWNGYFLVFHFMKWQSMDRSSWHHQNVNSFIFRFISDSGPVSRKVARPSPNHNNTKYKLRNSKYLQQIVTKGKIFRRLNHQSITTWTGNRCKNEMNNIELVAFRPHFDVETNNKTGLVSHRWGHRINQTKENKSRTKGKTDWLGPYSTGNHCLYEKYEGTTNKKEEKNGEWKVSSPKRNNNKMVVASARNRFQYVHFLCNQGVRHQMTVYHQRQHLQFGTEQIKPTFNSNSIIVIRSPHGWMDSAVAEYVSL